MIGYLSDLVRENAPLSEKVIKEFHYLLLKGTEEEREAGRYRSVPVVIQGTAHIPPQPYLIASKMEQLVGEYPQTACCSHSEIIQQIARLYADFVHIHPFIDGNGRTGRLLMNFELMKKGYPLAILSAEERANYYDALAQADNGDYQAITQLIESAVKNSIIEILNIICPEW